MNLTLLIALIVLNVPVYLFFGKSFFGGWGGFVEALRYSFTPDVISLFRGEFGEDRWQSMKLGFFVLLCVGTVAAEEK